MDTLVLCLYIVLCNCHFPFTLISYFLMHLQLRFVVIDSRNRSQLFGLIKSVKGRFPVTAAYGTRMVCSTCYSLDLNIEVAFGCLARSFVQMFHSLYHYFYWDADKVETIH